LEAIVLAGGFGTRIQSVVSDVPKPMAPVAGNPFLYYILQSLVKQDIDRIILAVGYKKDSIINHFGNRFENIEILYSLEDEPLGTGGGIRKAVPMAEGDEVLVINGDTYFDIPLSNLIKFHCKGSFDLTMSLKPMENFDRYGSVIIDQDRVVGMKEKKPCKEGLINGGVYVVKKSILDKFPPDFKFSFETEVLEKGIYNMRIGAYVSDGYFIDIGIPEDYAKAQEDFGYRDGKEFG
jgi:D-glycero-alpha-D-manno-heptose 1-phosphate guanylyltransferase